MSSNSWNQTLITAQGDGSALSNTTTPTSILPAAAKLLVPGNLLKIGDIIRIRALMRISTAASTPGTLTFDVRAGTSTVIFNGGASPTVATSASNLTADLEAYLTVRSIGTSGTVLGAGRLLSAGAVGDDAHHAVADQRACGRLVVRHHEQFRARPVRDVERGERVELADAAPVRSGLLT